MTTLPAPTMADSVLAGRARAARRVSHGLGVGQLTPLSRATRSPRSPLSSGSRDGCRAAGGGRWRVHRRIDRAASSGERRRSSNVVVLAAVSRGLRHGSGAHRRTAPWASPADVRARRPGGAPSRGIRSVDARPAGRPRPRSGRLRRRRDGRRTTGRGSTPHWSSTASPTRSRRTFAIGDGGGDVRFAASCGPPQQVGEPADRHGRPGSPGCSPTS